MINKLTMCPVCRASQRYYYMRKRRLARVYQPLKANVSAPSSGISLTNAQAQQEVDNGICEFKRIAYYDE